MIKKKTIKVSYKTDLKHEGYPVWGLSYGTFEISINTKSKGKKLLEIMIHECLHELFPKAEENEIETKAAILARTLWKEGFRKIDNHDRIKMQDEK